MSTVELPTRLPRWLLARRGTSLPVERMRLRLAAYVYGGTLVLGAIALANGETIVDGHAALVVAATTATTYLAHVLAHRVGEQIGHPRGTERDHWLQEARDSTPILFAGITPTVVLLLPMFTSLPTEAAQLIAGGWIVLQFSLLGTDVARLSGRRPTARTLWSGIALALAAGVVVVLKVTLAH
ncbi:hypothetical protein [Microcella alkaliphila]|uniref:Integral membrane protein n=1 Tax=Microcella alkaliphila TaxID=279828 RepID=A0A0U5B6P0_9MICO|nr:hypothetical protein [Microcella alkaliphila]BAU31584.1 uncharacterized protein MalAC0309_0716 [Microcella alkaliphila]